MPLDRRLAERQRHQWQQTYQKHPDMYGLRPFSLVAQLRPKVNERAR